MENLKELKKVVQRRNFYTTRDTGKIYLYALLLPFVFGLIFSYISIFAITNSGAQFAEGENVIQTIFEKYLWFSIPFMLLTQVVFLLVYFCYNKTNRIKQTSCNLSFKKAKVWTSLLSVFVGIVCVLGFMLLIEGSFGTLFKVVGLKQSNLGLPINSVGWLFVNLLVCGILPGICEELLFRGMIFQGLKERFSSLQSIFLSAILFALIHQSVMQFIYPFILGCILAFVMEKTNNLLYPILIHTFNNFTTIIISYLQKTNVISIPFESMTWWLILISIVVAVAVCGILYVIYRFYLKKQSKIEIEKEGEVVISNYASVGKFPLTLVFGILLAIIFTVINAIG